jgi:hypothetical protein
VIAVADPTALPFESLDFVYAPSRDAAADVDHFTRVLSARLVFAIEAFRTRVAMVRLSDHGPCLLFAEHLAGEQPILIYRVADLDRAVADLERRGCRLGRSFEIPHGPGWLLDTPGGQHLAIYQLTRPEAAARLQGRRDF